MKTNMAAVSHLAFDYETNFGNNKMSSGTLYSTRKAYATATLVSTIEFSQEAHLLCFSKWPPAAILD